LEFLEDVGVDSDATLDQLFSYFDPQLLYSTAAWNTDLYPRPLDQVHQYDHDVVLTTASFVHFFSHPFVHICSSFQVLITDFFAAVSPVLITPTPFPIQQSEENLHSDLLPVPPFESHQAEPPVWGPFVLPFFAALVGATIALGKLVS